MAAQCTTRKPPVADPAPADRSRAGPPRPAGRIHNAPADPLRSVDPDEIEESRNDGTRTEQDPTGGNKPKPPAGSGGTVRAPRTGAGPRAGRCRPSPRPARPERPPGPGNQGTGGAGHGRREHAPPRRQAGGPGRSRRRHLRGHDGLGGGRPGHRDRRRAGHREMATGNSAEPLLYAGDAGPRLGGRRGDHHPGVRLQHGRGQLAAGGPVSPPTVLEQPATHDLGGKSPAMLYYGAEYCPYCAAERWAMTAALSRFGTWSELKITASSHTDVFPRPTPSATTGPRSPAPTSPSAASSSTPTSRRGGSAGSPPCRRRPRKKQTS